MTDADAAQIVLQWFYDNQDKLGWSSLTLTPATFEDRFDLKQLHRLVRRLKEDDLVQASCSKEVPFQPNFPIHPLAITRAGIDTIQLAAPMTENKKLMALLDAISKTQDTAQTRGMDARERIRMLELIRDERLAEVTFTAGNEVVAVDILPRGRAVLSGEVPSPFDPKPPPASQTFNLHGPNYGQVGSDNTQNVNVAVHLQALAQAVMEAEGMPEASKRTALERLHALASDGTVGNAAGVASFIFSLLEKLPGG